MAIYDISQATIKQSDCEAKTSLVDKEACYKSLIEQYQEVIKTNTDALNGPASASGTYAILSQFQSRFSQCGSDYQCSAINLSGVNITKSEIATREGRINAAKSEIKTINEKIKSITTTPKYTDELKSSKLKRNLIIIGAIIVVIIIALWLWKKYYKKG